MQWNVIRLLFSICSIHRHGPRCNRICRKRPPPSPPPQRQKLTGLLLERKHAENESSKYVSGVLGMYLVSYIVRSRNEPGHMGRYGISMDSDLQNHLDHR